MKMEAVELKNKSDRTWRVFKVNSETVADKFYLVEVASYGNTHCTCWAFVMGTRRPCKHINLVLETKEENDKKELEQRKQDLLSDLCDIVIEHAAIDGLPYNRNPEGVEPPTIYMSDWNSCREAMMERLQDWVKEIFSKPSQ